MENETLKLLQPAPEEMLLSWLAEFYGKPVRIEGRTLLRHRDLSYVERLWVSDGLPKSLIYKLVLPPWDIEHDLHERILIPSISNSAQLYLSAHYGELTAMFIEDLGSNALTKGATREIAQRVGKELAKMHRAYVYRIDELQEMRILNTLYPIDYEEFASRLAEQLYRWRLVGAKQVKDIKLLANLIGPMLAGEPISVVHGDLYAENLILRNDRLFIIDWSWFTHFGVPLMDLATVTQEHVKNASFHAWRDDVIDAYCFESGRQTADVVATLPAAETLSRLLFLHWLVVRRSRGIMGTTVGPVDDLIARVVAELRQRLALFAL